MGICKVIGGSPACRKLSKGRGFIAIPEGCAGASAKGRVGTGETGWPSCSGERVGEGASELDELGLLTLSDERSSRLSNTIIELSDMVRGIAVVVTENPSKVDMFIICISSTLVVLAAEAGAGGRVPLLVLSIPNSSRDWKTKLSC